MASRRARTLGVCAFVLLAASGARVQLSEAQALAQVFGEATLRERVFALDEGQVAALSERLGYAPRERIVRFYEASRDGRMLGHAIVMTELGKSLPMRFLVSIRSDGTVDQVVLMRFLEPRGWEVERAAFRSQYHGKSAADPIRRGQDIRNISGATISVDAMNRGVKRALALHALLLDAPSAPAANGAGAD